LPPTLGAASVELTRDDLVAIVEQMVLTAVATEPLVWKPQANDLTTQRPPASTTDSRSGQFL
jgi:hypothetical protein